MLNQFKIEIFTLISLKFNTAYACDDTRPVLSACSSFRSPVATVIKQRPFAKPLSNRSNTASALKLSSFDRSATLSGIQPVNACKSILYFWENHKIYPKIQFQLIKRNELRWISNLHYSNQENHSRPSLSCTPFPKAIPKIHFYCSNRSITIDYIDPLANNHQSQLYVGFH